SVGPGQLVQGVLRSAKSGFAERKTCLGDFQRQCGDTRKPTHWAIHNLGTWSELFGKLVVNGFDRAPETGRVRSGDGFAVQELGDSRLEVLEVAGIRGELEVVDGPPV